MNPHPLNQAARLLQQTLEKERDAGQIKTEERLTIAGIFSATGVYLVSLTQRAFFLTAWRLTVSPGEACRRFVEGYRQSLHQPIEYLILTGGLATLFNFRYHFFADSYAGWTSIYRALPEYSDFLAHFFNYSEEYNTITNVVSIPVFSVVSYLFFINRPYNLAEVLAMNFYIACQQMFFLLLFIPLIEIFPSLKTFLFLPAYSILVILYNIWAYVQFFGGNRWIGIFKASVSVILSYFLQLPFNLLIYSLLQPYLKYFVF